MTRARIGRATWLLATHLVVLSGCAEGNGVTRLDGSILRPLSDGGTPPLPAPDVGPRPTDSGGGVPPPFTCTTAGPHTLIETVSCTTATVECLTGCTTPECQAACFDADPECYSCVYNNVYACTETMGCQSEWDAYICCAELNGCLDVFADPMCVSASCAPQEQIYGDCFNATYDACTPAYAPCFPS